MRFITSDQPTLNLKPGEDHNDLVLYYPVSPNRAMLLERQDQESLVHSEDNLTDDLVAMLNRKMYKGSYEQVFGTDGQYLKSWVGRV